MRIALVREVDAEYTCWARGGSTIGSIMRESFRSTAIWFCIRDQPNHPAKKGSKCLIFTNSPTYVDKELSLCSTVLFGPTSEVSNEYACFWQFQYSTPSAWNKHPIVHWRSRLVLITVKVRPILEWLAYSLNLNTSLGSRRAPARNVSPILWRPAFVSTISRRKEQHGRIPCLISTSAQLVSYNLTSIDHSNTCIFSKHSKLLCCCGLFSDG